MGRLDLSSLLNTGMYADIHLVCTGKKGNKQTFKVHRSIVFSQCQKLKELVLESSTVRDELFGVDVVDLPLEPEIFERVLAFLYSGEYQVRYQAAGTQAEDGEEEVWDNTPHSLFYSTRICGMAQQFDIIDLFSESAAALCAAVRNALFHVDLPAVLDELYATLGTSPYFTLHLASIPHMVAHKMKRFKIVRTHLRRVLFKQPVLAADILDATMEALEKRWHDLSKLYRISKKARRTRELSTMSNAVLAVVAEMMMIRTWSKKEM
ncbi:hypothetical protein CGCA056_v006604 [Colletotrichum aenigma]|uniref:uncharacterized protein n=1 Tax=Colletotrichum aenigma TaxID=1215731 RepID=UPI0018724D83|nr:uncharacterized protein CGCA056_v006604 [Colletotrichum aenigma]KAF5521546.1 hypothetical protein CGCA056_v006604 [Colletotrichum aenigma]